MELLDAAGTLGAWMRVIRETAAPINVMGYTLDEESFVAELTGARLYAAST